MKIDIPRQAYHNAATEYLETVAEVTNSSVKIYVVMNFVIQPAIAASLSLLWGLINGLQIVTFLLFFNIPIPANVLIVNEVLYEVANFDLIPLDWL